ncbi:MAG: S8 family serine peptidase [Anaerolineaceae bacterium]|nr:S8 family serine peptidase [Anaerolineaceae bacterium]
MKNKHSKISIIVVITMLLVGCSSAKTLSPLPTPSISRHPLPMNNMFNTGHPSSIPQFDPANLDPFVLDFRMADLRDLDFTNNPQAIEFADFDSKTTWPDTTKLPPDVSPQAMMEQAKDPGLNIRKLHAEGITGKGIGIAIIDQTLLVDHQEYVNQLQFYYESNETAHHLTSMHGPAVASIAVGKTIGVAPEADLYYIARDNCGVSLDIENYDFSCLAKDVLKVVEINQSLPQDRKIRVLSMSIGWSPQNPGYDEINAAVEKAKESGIFVVSSSLTQTDGLSFSGLGRKLMADPNDPNSYLPGNFWSIYYYTGSLDLQNKLLVPMDARTTASPTGPSDYVYYGTGGWSWSIPYIAGMYALVCQINPDITPDVFWAAALKTGDTIKVEHDGKTFSLGVILNPEKLIAEFKR